MRFEIESNADSTFEGTARVDILPTTLDSLLHIVIDDAEEESRSFEHVFIDPIPIPLTNTKKGPDVADNSDETFPAMGVDEIFLAMGHNETRFETDKTTMVDCFL